MRLDHCVGSPSQSVFLQQRRLAVRRCRADSFWWDHPIALFLSLARVLCRIYRTVPYGAPRWRIVLADFCPAPRGLRAFIHTHIHVLGRALLTTIHRAQYIRLLELACVNSILSCYLTLSPPLDVSIQPVYLRKSPPLLFSFFLLSTVLVAEGQLSPRIIRSTS